MVLVEIASLSPSDIVSQNQNRHLQHHHDNHQQKKCPICLRDGVKAENYIACCEACKYIKHWNKHGISVRRVSSKHKRTAQEEFQLFESLAGQASMRAFAWLGLSTLQWTALTYRVLSPVVTGVAVNKCNNQWGMMSLPLFQGGYILHLLKSLF